MLLPVKKHLSDIVYDIIIKVVIVADANVLLSALRSRNGASYVVLRRMLSGHIAFAVTPAIVLEYEAVLKRDDMLGEAAWIRSEQIDTILDALCAKAELVEPWFRFRPFLDDAGDDAYIECALAAGARIILSRDRHFRHPAVAAFGLRVLTAGAFLGERQAGQV